MLDQLCPEHLPLLRTNKGGSARMRPGIERPCLSPLDHVPPDSLIVHTEDPCRLRFVHAAINCCQNLGSQVGGIGSHTFSLLPLHFLENRFSWWL